MPAILILVGMLGWYQYGLVIVLFVQNLYVATSVLYQDLLIDHKEDSRFCLIVIDFIYIIEVFI
jgi:hypothetical protein